MYRIGMTDL